MYLLVVEGEELFGLVVELEEVCFFLVPVAWVVVFSAGRWGAGCWGWRG